MKNRDYITNNTITKLGESRWEMFRQIVASRQGKQLDPEFGRWGQNVKSDGVVQYYDNNLVWSSITDNSLKNEILYEEIMSDLMNFVGHKSRDWVGEPITDDLSIKQLIEECRVIDQRIDHLHREISDLNSRKNKIKEIIKPLMNLF